MKVEEAYIDVLQNIEFAVANECRRNPSLKDGDVLEAIQALIRRYAAEERGQIHVPSVHLAQPSLGVFESVKTMCEWRRGRTESVGAGGLDMTAVPPNDVGGILCCLKRIRGSIQHWTHEGGSRGYLNYMTSFALPELRPGHDHGQETVSTSISAISDGLWQRLYDLAAQVRELAPWEWMTEMDVFGVEMPSGGDTIFVSVMGALGEHFAVVVYPSADAVRAFWALEEDEDAPPERVLEIRQTHVSFESAGRLEPQDRRLLKRFGLSFKGQKCPLFRSYKPGFVPWFLDVEEAEMLRLALEQLLDVAPRARINSSLLWPEGESDMCLVRSRQGDGQNATWRDEFREVAPSQNPSVYIKLDNGQIREYRRLPQMRNPIEMDFFLVRASIVEDAGRPRMPYVLMLVDSESGVVLAHELVTIETSMSDMWSGMFARLMGIFIDLRLRPTRLTVRPGPLAVIAQALSEVLGFQLRIDRKTPSLNRAKAGLLRMMAGG